MRCLTLAVVLQQRGATVRFLSRALPIYLCDMLAAKGMEIEVLDSDVVPGITRDLAHSHWLEVAQQQDAADCILALSGQHWDWLVVDHYALDVRWEARLRGSAGKIMVIDDLADRQHDCDLLLDQNFYADMQIRYAGKVPVHCQLLLGPRYAMLRDEFRELRHQLKPRTGTVERILVFFGGVDTENYTGLVINALAALSLKSIQVDVVIGAQHPYRLEIEGACAVQGYVCHVQTRRMAELMATADLAIGAGGTATWERCCLGLPALTFCTAENQKQQLADAAGAGFLYAPIDGSDLHGTLVRHTMALLENDSLRKLISRTAINAVDGNGLLRVVSMMSLGDIEIRRATKDDAQKLYEWRNHPLVRGASLNSGVISLDEHQLWFADVLANENRLLLIGHRGEVPVGVVRFDCAGDVAEVSIYLVPEAGCQGQGRNLLCCAEQWLRGNRPDIRQIRALVLEENQSSKRLFEFSKYHPETICYLKELAELP
jgi:UDP-2,4-diacetamido-2,4,6-trideoxy-beta-L-altropyranose hydrolase